jgi:hypothetical protein
MFWRGFPIAAFVSLATAVVAMASAANPQPVASPAPASPSPAPSASEQPATPSTSATGFSLAVSGSEAFIDHATGGPGQTPPEGPGFAAGQPLSPITPYDWFSSAPLLPGSAGQIQYQLTGTYRTPSVVMDASFVVSGVTGDVTNAIFWGEPLVGQLDPHEGHSYLPYQITFPTRAGTNDATAGEIVTPYFLSVHAPDARWTLTGGYVTPAHYDAFVFLPPGLTSVPASMNLQTFESVGPPIADLNSWSHLTSTLPLLGADAQGRVGSFTVEATDALLPVPPVTSARMTGGAIVLDRGDAGRFSLDLISVDTHGNALVVPTLFGADPTIHPGPEGGLATSLLADQRQTIAGFRAFLHPLRGYDALAEVGRSWYDAGLVARPGTAQPGDYEHYSLTRNFSGIEALGVEYYRMDPRYATMVLPYGVPENIWGNPWQYPGPWLKGTYQLVNDNFGGSNRLGFRVHGDLTRGRLETHAAAYSYRQIFPSTYANLTQTGFVEVDYLALQPGDLTFGHTRGLNSYAAWHLDHDTLSIDYAHDLQHRDFTGNAATDLVAIRYPQAIIAEQHSFSKRLIGEAGYGRYEVEGTWATTPVDAFYGMGFVGTEWDFGKGQQLFVQLRKFGLNGAPSIPGGPPPTLHGTAIVVDHHISF